MDYAIASLSALGMTMLLIAVLYYVVERDITRRD